MSPFTNRHKFLHKHPQPSYLDYTILSALQEKKSSLPIFSRRLVQAISGWPLTSVTPSHVFIRHNHAIVRRMEWTRHGPMHLSRRPQQVGLHTTRNQGEFVSPQHSDSRQLITTDELEMLTCRWMTTGSRSCAEADDVRS